MEQLLQCLEKDWEEIKNHGAQISFKANQTIFYEGHHPYGLFVITEGKVRFEADHSHLQHIRQGDVVGLPHVLDGTPSCCACVAVTDCQTLFISKTALLPYLKKHQETKRGRSIPKKN